MISAVDAVRAELARVSALARSLEPTEWNLPSRCDDWTVSDVVGHLVNDFERYAEWLDESQAGELDPPFSPEHLRSDNAMRLEQLAGVPGPDRVTVLQRAAGLWLARIETLDYETPQRHPRGLFTVGTQAWWAAGECAIHGWDIATALGRDWDAPDSIEQLAASWSDRGPLEDGDLWTAMLRMSGRHP